MPDSLFIAYKYMYCADQLLGFLKRIRYRNIQNMLMRRPIALRYGPVKAKRPASTIPVLVAPY